MLLPQGKYYTLADVLCWDDRERWELIDGVPLMMAPPARIHQKISGELFGQLREYLKGKKCEVYAAPFAVRLFEENGDLPERVDTLVEPDISVICDKNKLNEKGCNGAPDWIIEIVSPSTSSLDYGIKLFKYRTAGVREYWIINPMTHTINVYDLESEKGTYQYNFDDNIPVCIYDDLTIRISELL